MTRIFARAHLRRTLGLALLCAFALTFLLPAVASAHAILLRSNPASNAVLQTAPTQVQLWFSEELSPALSTAEVVNAERQRVDNGDAHINASDDTEIDLSLHANLRPDVYIVVWRSDAADDGHVLHGSFNFTVANPDGTVPQLAPGADPGQGILGNVSGGSAGTLDGTAFFNLVMVTLVELGAIFWVGAQIWVNFVLPGASEKHREEEQLNTSVEQRFTRFFSLPTLIVLLLANLGVLYGQVLTLTGNDWTEAFNWQLLREQATSGNFGIYWLMRMAVLLLALLIGLFVVLSKNRFQTSKRVLPLVNLFLGALLFLAMTMSGHAAAVSSLILPYSIVIDWLHLSAAALWIGSMCYILLVYLPALNKHSLSDRTRSLLAILPQYSPLAIAGIVLMAVTGPLNATFHLTSLNQFVSTAYGRALLVKIFLICLLLLTSAYHVFRLRPRLQKEYRKYSYARQRLDNGQGMLETASATEDSETKAEGGEKLLAQQVKLREQRLQKKTTLMTRILAWEPWLGVAVIVCVGLMNVFAGTLVPTTTQTSGNQNNTTVSGPFSGSAPTSDKKYNIMLTVSPNTFGTNVFTVQVTDAATGKTLGASDLSVSIDVTMLDMDMGTQTATLTPNGKGGFSGSEDFAMGGNWSVKVLLHTPDGTLHSASFKLYAPF